MFRPTVEIALPIDGSIVFSRSILELYADPVASSEVGVTDELYCCFDAIGLLDRLPDVEVGKLEHGNLESWQCVLNSWPHKFNRFMALLCD